MINRRIVLAAALALLAACSQSGGGGQAVGDLEAQADMTMGDANAKVKMIEYHSVACPYCAMFATTVFPDFKAKYIDTGKVYYISREALTHSDAIAANGFLMAHCAGKDKYFSVIDALYRRHYELFDHNENPSPDIKSVLLDIAKSAGLSEAQYTKCTSDEKALELIEQRWSQYIKEGYTSTPTILINGKNVNPTAVELNEAVEAALKS